MQMRDGFEFVLKVMDDFLCNQALKSLPQCIQDFVHGCTKILQLEWLDHRGDELHECTLSSG